LCLRRYLPHPARKLARPGANTLKPWYRPTKMKTLARSGDFQEILTRLHSLAPRAAALWGRMSLQQMLCHVADAMLIPLGEIKADDASNFPLRTVWKWWPKGWPAPREIDQCLQNRPPTGFEDDCTRVRQLLLRFRNTNLGGYPHPLFGPLRQTEWLRWGWLHADHHLRQFGH
jgi:hypothetical protein